MAYVIWRVFMKKYAKMRLGIQRGITTVNPAEPPIPPDPELWQRRDEFFGCEEQAASAPPSVPAQTQVHSKQKQDQQQSKKQEQQKRKQEQQQLKTKQEQQQQEEQPVVERRKSGGRAKRVRSYLKKCRRAATGGSSSQSTEEAAASRTSSWYVEHYHVAEQSQEHVCEEHVCELPLDKVEVLRARDLYDDSANAPARPGGEECDQEQVGLRAADELAAPESSQAVASRDDAELVRGAQRPPGGEGAAGRHFAEEERPLDSVELRPGLDGPGDVLDSRTEGGTPLGEARGHVAPAAEVAPRVSVSQAVEEISEDPISGGKCTADKAVYANLDAESAETERTEEHRDKCAQSATKSDVDSALLASDSEAVEWHDARSETPEPTAAPAAVAIETPIALPESGVPGLVARHLGGVYPRFASVRAALERQARDLLVVRYQGRLAALEDLFLRPAAHLAAALLAEARSKGGDAIWAPGWPLTLGDRLVLHLGDVEGLRLRLGRQDCYCCVRPAERAGAVEAALVWRGGGGGAAPPVGSPMELPAQLRSLLASAERALAPDRLPLEAALFPCKAAGGGCGCDRASPPRRASVPVRDSAMQTCPLFEVAGSLPHIDSDDDDDAPPAEAAAAPQHQAAHEDRSTSTDQCCPLVATPRSITEVPDRLLMAGITLPGTHDVRGRPLIMFDSQSVARASLDRQQVATLLLYYASIPTEERLSGGVCVLVASCGGGEAASLELVDQALALLAARGGPAVGCALLWRPAGRKPATASAATLAASGVQYHVVCGEEALRDFVAAEQAPAVCGGRCDHDQLEWVEFHKELEPLTAQAHACGRRLVLALQDLRAGAAAEPALASRRQLHAQQRLLARALADPELARLRADGAAALDRLQQRAQWLPASQDVRLSLERAERLLTEVERASRRLETLCDARRERLRDLARLRALQHESEQVLSWLCQKGEETLRRHSQLATSLPAIKEQENDFEKFYFISMRHLDKGSDLLEECSGEARGGGGGGGGGLRDLARSLKTHLLGFSERLEDTRERLEDTSRCFCLLDKAYEWALETMKYVSRVKTGEAATAEQGLQLLRNLRQYLMAHPPVAEEHFHEMLALARKLANDKLLEQAKVAQARCQETMELIHEQQTRLVRLRRELGAEDADGDETLLLGLDQLAAATVPATGTPASSTTLSGSGRRRSLGAFPYIYKCSHHAEGRACSCCDPTPPPPDYASSAASVSVSGNSSSSGASATGGRLNGIREEEREGSEDGSKEEESSVTATIAEDEYSRCDHQQPDHPQPLVGKRPLRRACTWQYPVESFEDEGVSCTGGDDKCGYSGGGSTTDGSDGCPKNGEDLEEHDNSSGSGSKPMPPVPVNSHLHCHTSNLNIQADSAKELKTQKTLLLIMREMIQTERDYVKSLEYVIQNYIPELLREDIPQALRGQRNVIFGNIEKIFEFHSQYFLQELEHCENSPLLVGQSFLRHEKKFYLYALYNKNKPKSDSLMSEYGTSFFKGKQLELGDKMDLASYLLKPVQRMGKYALLLQQLMKAYPDKESEIADIRAAEQMVRFQLRHGNDLLAMDSLRDCDVNVKEQGRLLRQNEFLVWQGKGKKCLRHVFLFEELILFSKARRFPDRKNLDLYIYKNSIKMTDIGLTAKIGDSPTKFEIWFRKRKPNDTFTLQSMSEEIKQAWTEEISKLLWKQALRNREMRLAEMSSMGIGNKPCLDIRPSADQINDRSISIAQLSKTAPRFRNSITVAPGELSRNNKRPHSIISVSSSSSSAGSNSSHGTLHLGFESADSPRAHHRSTTLHSQCSTESGIIADMSLGSEDADTSHWHVERSNSSATSVSLDSSLSPVSPTEDLKTCLEGVQMKGQETTELQSPDSGVVPDEMSVKL